MIPQDLWISPSGRIPEDSPAEDIIAKAKTIVTKEYPHNIYCGKNPLDLLIKIGWCAVWQEGKAIIVTRLTRAQLDGLIDFRAQIVDQPSWGWFDGAFNALVERDSRWF